MMKLIETIGYIRQNISNLKLSKYFRKYFQT